MTMQGLEDQSLARGVGARRTSVEGIVREGDPREVRDYVVLAAQEGFTPLTIDQGRYALNRYIRWLKGRGVPSTDKAGLREFVAFRAHLLRRRISRYTVRNYLNRIVAYYFIRMRASGEVEQIELCRQLEAMNHIFNRHQRYESHKPLSMDTLRRVLAAARRQKHLTWQLRTVKSEDYTFLQVLIWTGGRAAMYGLRVDEIHFREHEIRTHVKGGKLLTIPLHPELERVLRRFLATRDFQSGYVFRHGRDPRTFRGAENNTRNAELICERARAAAGLTERIYPHRFRATFATMARAGGLKLEFVQAILGHADPLTTLRSYVNVDVDDLRRDFATLELAPGLRSSPREEALRRLAPRGTQHGWNLVVKGLLALTDTVPKPAPARRPVEHRGRRGHPRKRS